MYLRSIVSEGVVCSSSRKFESVSRSNPILTELAAVPCSMRTPPPPARILICTQKAKAKEVRVSPSQVSGIGNMSLVLEGVLENTYCLIVLQILSSVSK